MKMKTFSVAMPLWVRAILLAGVIFVVLGAGLVGYRLYTQPINLSIAVGSLDGEAVKIASIVSGRLAATNSSVRLKILQADNALEAAKLFAAGKADLAVVRADAGDLSQAQSVAVVMRGALMIVAPPGSPITSIDKLKGHTVGVVGSEINQKIVAALEKEYDLAGKVTFKHVGLLEARRALQSKEVSALLFVIPVAEKYLALVRRLFPEGRTATPVFIPVEAAGAIADVEGAYEVFELPQGMLRGSPPVPDDDVSTLQVAFYMVANKKLDPDPITALTQSLMSTRRELVAEQPVLSGLAAADTDADAFIPVHPGAAAFYNGTQQSFIDKYSDWIYLTPMVLGGLASVFAAGWRFLGIRQSESEESTLKTLFAMPRRIRNAGSQDELASIEGEADRVLQAELAKAVDGERGALDASTLISVAHRLEDLIHDRKAVVAASRSSGI